MGSNLDAITTVFTQQDIPTLIPFACSCVRGRSVSLSEIES